MPTPYVGANTFPASSNLPSDGDAKDAASVNTPLQALFDRTERLLKDLDGTNPGKTLLSPHIIGGAGQVEGQLAARGTGFFCDRPSVTGPDSSVFTFNIIDGDLLYTPTFTAPRTWVIGDTGIQGGARIRIYYKGTNGWTLTLNRSDASLIAHLVDIGHAASGYFQWVDIATDGSAHDWSVCGGQVFP